MFRIVSCWWLGAIYLKKVQIYSLIKANDHSRLHHYKILFCEALKKDLGGGHIKKPPRLMPSINQGGHFLLTEAVSENYLAKSINRGGQP